MTTKLELPENTSVSRWLAELHMECYKKNLENFDSVKVSTSSRRRAHTHKHTVAQNLHFCKQRMQSVSAT